MKIIFLDFDDTKNPLLFILYALIALISRIYSIFLPKYNVFWKIYKSTKRGVLAN